MDAHNDTNRYQSYQSNTSPGRSTIENSLGLSNYRCSSAELGLSGAFRHSVYSWGPMLKEDVLYSAKMNSLKKKNGLSLWFWGPSRPACPAATASSASRLTRHWWRASVARKPQRCCVSLWMRLVYRHAVGIGCLLFTVSAEPPMGAFSYMKYINNMFRLAYLRKKTDIRTHFMPGCTRFSLNWNVATFQISLKEICSKFSSLAVKNDISPQCVALMVSNIRWDVNMYKCCSQSHLLIARLRLCADFLHYEQSSTTTKNVTSFDDNFVLFIVGRQLAEDKKPSHSDAHIQ